MTEAAIRVENLSKKFKIGPQQSRYDTLRDLLMDLVRKKKDRKQEREFWALRDVSFEVKRGEVVGVIGRNGAGKSTLLKILSQITEPTSGRAVINGRVGSLLEVGTGFHPELSGRENIYLNGAILGMKREEIRRKFDEIVDFAEIEKFLDTPVKHYSSGMYVRLAFAVAAHLEPEILLVDEVLAVGDAAFQTKCMGKMGNIAGEGRTVVFVSHNMSAIQRLCQSTLLLAGGELRQFGQTGEVINKYLAELPTSSLKPAEWNDIRHLRDRQGDGQLRFEKVYFSSGNERLGNKPYTGGPLEVRVLIQSNISTSLYGLSVFIADQNGVNLMNADIRSKGLWVNIIPGVHEVRFAIQKVNLNPGRFVLGLWSANIGFTYDFVTSAGYIEIEKIEDNKSGTRADGLVACDFAFEGCKT